MFRFFAGDKGNQVRVPESSGLTNIMSGGCPL